MHRLSAHTPLLATLAVAAAAVAAAFAVPAPAQAMTILIGDDGPSVTGSGHAASVARPVGAFSTLRLESGVDVVAHPGPHPGVVVHADDNVEPLIETVVDGDALVVRLRKGTRVQSHLKLSVDVEFAQLTGSQQRGSGDLRITALTAPRFDSKITGSGDLRVENAAIGSLNVRVAGSGDVAVVGHADEARYAVAGSGDIDAYELPTQRVLVSISGSGDAHVNATASLDASVAGSGDVRYRGHPADVKRRVAGSGSVEPAR